MEFTFPDREETDLEQMNAPLSSVNWSEVDLEDFNGYHAKTSTMDPKSGAVRSVTLRYGFDWVVLECGQIMHKPGYRYQVEAEYCTQAVSSDESHDRWLEAHPDCVMGVLSCISFDDGGKAFAVFATKKAEIHLMINKTRAYRFHAETWQIVVYITKSSEFLTFCHFLFGGLLTRG